MTESTSENKVVSPVWDIFSPEDVDLSTVEKELIEYREINVSNIESLSRFEIETRDKDSFIQPHDGFLEVHYYFSNDANGVNFLSTSDRVALQNHPLSLFQNIYYYIEDQLIEQCDYPAIAYTVKNLTDYSTQYGTISSDAGFYLDTKDDATTSNNNVRFFNVTAPRTGYELFFQQNGANNLIPTIPVNANNAPPTGFFDGDTVQAYINVTSVVPGGANGRVVGTPVVFYSYPLATFGTRVTGTITFDTTANGSRLLLSGGAANNIIGAYVDGYGANVNFLSNGTIPLNLPTIGANNVITMAGGAQGNLFTANAIMQNSYGCYNVGFDRRQALCQQSIEAQIFIPLKEIFGFCRGYDKVSRGLRHKVVLNKQSNSQAIFRQGDNQANSNKYLQIDYISMWIPRLKPSLEVLKQIEAKLSSNDLYTCFFTDLNCYRTPAVYISDSVDSAFQLATMTKRPVRVWVVFQKLERVQDTQTVNKRVFDHMNTSQIQIRLNDRIYPLYQYIFNNTPPTAATPGPPYIPPILALWQNYNRDFVSLMNGGHKLTVGEENGSMFDYNTFSQLYPIFFFDLEHQPEDLYTAVKYAELQVIWSNQAVNGGGAGLGQGAFGGYYMYMIVESERVIKFKGVSGSLSLQL